MIPEIDSLNNEISLDERRRDKLNEKIEKIKKEGQWAGDLEISATCVMLNINIYLYIKDNFYYSPYFKFEVVQNPTDIIEILFVDSNHFNLLYKKNHIFNIPNDSYININTNDKHNNNENLKKVMESKINKNPNKESVEKIIDKTKNSDFENKCDYQRNSYLNKYNDVYLFLIDNTYIPDKFKSDKGKEKKNMLIKEPIFVNNVAKILKLKITD